MGTSAVIDGFSAAKGGAQRHQYLPPAACASEFEPTIERDNAQRTDSSRYRARAPSATASIEIQAPSRPKQQHNRSDAPHKPSTSTRPDRERPNRRATKMGSLPLRRTEAERVTKKKLRSMYIATIENGKSKNPARRQRVGRATKRRGQTATARTRRCARNHGDTCGAQRVRIRRRTTSGRNN